MIMVIVLHLLRARSVTRLTQKISHHSEHRRVLLAQSVHGDSVGPQVESAAQKLFDEKNTKTYDTTCDFAHIYVG